MASEPAIAFASPASQAATFEVRVNFGVFAGRAATPAEIDQLARRLLPQIGPVSIVSEERHEISESAEARLHQVRLEIQRDALPSDPSERESLQERVVEEAGRWASACAAERHTPE